MTDIFWDIYFKFYWPFLKFSYDMARCLTKNEGVIQIYLPTGQFWGHPSLANEHFQTLDSICPPNNKHHQPIKIKTKVIFFFLFSYLCVLHFLYQIFWTRNLEVRLGLPEDMRSSSISIFISLFTSLQAYGHPNRNRSLILWDPVPAS